MCAFGRKHKRQTRHGWFVRVCRRLCSSSHRGKFSVFYWSHIDVWSEDPVVCLISYLLRLACLCFIILSNSLCRQYKRIGSKNIFQWNKKNQKCYNLLVNLEWCLSIRHVSLFGLHVKIKQIYKLDALINIYWIESINDLIMKCVCL